jgi:hypothetical protein
MGFIVQDAQDITYDNATITNSRVEVLVLDNDSVKWNGTVISRTSGGPAERYD